MANEINARTEVLLRWPHDQAVAADAVYHVHANDGAGGAMEYDTAINPQPIPAWADGAEHRASWYRGDWYNDPWYAGVDPTSWYRAPWYRGDWYRGAAGMVHYTTDALADGDWEFAVVAEDPAGNKTTPAAVTAEITLAGTPQPPTNLQAAAYDDGTDTLTLTWTLSTDDQAA